jgi:hypothetical protein
MSVASPVLNHRVSVFRSMGRLDRTIAIALHTEHGTSTVPLTITEAKQIAQRLNTLANEERRRRKR